MSSQTVRWDRFDRKQRLGRFVGWLAVAVTVIVSWRFMAIDFVTLDTVPREVADLLTRMYPPDVAYTPQIIQPLIETIHIAALGTAGALVLSIPVALLAAENTTPNPATYWLGKLLVTVSRSVNTIIWALIFVVILGSGPLAGAVAIAFRSVGFLGKLLGEEVDDLQVPLDIEKIHVERPEVPHGRGEPAAGFVQSSVDDGDGAVRLTGDHAELPAPEGARVLAVEIVHDVHAVLRPLQAWLDDVAVEIVSAFGPAQERVAVRKGGDAERGPSGA
ncbi:MAG: hypothetical protein R6V31_10120, partial [Halohasta sp.]